MPKTVLVAKVSNSGYGVWIEEEISIVGRFSTKRKASGYLQKIAKACNTELENDAVSTDEDLYQIIQVDLDTLPVDPSPVLEDREED